MVEADANATAMTKSSVNVLVSPSLAMVESGSKFVANPVRPPKRSIAYSFGLFQLWVEPEMLIPDSAEVTPKVKLVAETRVGVAMILVG